MRTFVIQAAILGAMAWAAACSNDTTVITTPGGATYVVDSSALANGVMFAATDPFDPTFVAAATAPGVAATWASAAAAAGIRYYQPNTCVTATAQGNVVTYTLNNCAGPLSGVRMTGTITATYAQAQPQGVQVTIASSNLSAEGVSMNLNQTGLYTQSGNARQVTINEHSSALNQSGSTLTRTRTGTLTWTKGSTCATWNSSGGLELDGAAANETFTNQLLCTSECPQGTVTLSNPQNQSLIVTMDGTSRASYTDSAGTSGSTPIACNR